MVKFYKIVLELVFMLEHVGIGYPSFAIVVGTDFRSNSVKSGPNDQTTFNNQIFRSFN